MRWTAQALQLCLSDGGWGVRGEVGIVFGFNEWNRSRSRRIAVLDCERTLMTFLSQLTIWVLSLVAGTITVCRRSTSREQVTLMNARGWRTQCESRGREFASFCRHQPSSDRAPSKILRNMTSRSPALCGRTRNIIQRKCNVRTEPPVDLSDTSIRLGQTRFRSRHPSIGKA